MRCSHAIWFIAALVTIGCKSVDHAKSSSIQSLAGGWSLQLIPLSQPSPATTGKTESNSDSGEVMFCAYEIQGIEDQPTTASTQDFQKQVSNQLTPKAVSKTAIKRALVEILRSSAAHTSGGSHGITIASGGSADGEFQPKVVQVSNEQQVASQVFNYIRRNQLNYAVDIGASPEAVKLLGDAIRAASQANNVQSVKCESAAAELAKAEKSLQEKPLDQRLSEIAPQSGRGQASPTRRAEIQQKKYLGCMTYLDPSQSADKNILGCLAVANQDVRDAMCKRVSAATGTMLRYGNPLHAAAWRKCRAWEAKLGKGPESAIKVTFQNGGFWCNGRPLNSLKAEDAALCDGSSLTN